MLETKLETTYKWRINRFCLAHVKYFKNPFQHMLLEITITFSDFRSREIFMPRICFIDPNPLLQRLIKLFLHIIKFTNILTNNQHVIHIKQKNDKIIITKLLYKNTMITHCLAKTMILHKRIKLLLPLSWCLF